MGTPKTLIEAIENAICIGPLSGLRDRTRHSVRDYLSQRFGVAFLRAESPSELKRLEELWAQITGEKPKP